VPRWTSSNEVAVSLLEKEMPTVLFLKRKKNGSTTKK